MHFVENAHGSLPSGREREPAVGGNHEYHISDPIGSRTISIPKISIAISTITISKMFILRPIYRQFGNCIVCHPIRSEVYWPLFPGVYGSGQTSQTGSDRVIWSDPDPTPESLVIRRDSARSNPWSVEDVLTRPAG